ncbi:MAG: hypothetical protein AAF720_15730 [Pseudomonadota bacterium]
MTGVNRKDGIEPVEGIRNTNLTILNASDPVKVAGDCHSLRFCIERTALEGCEMDAFIVSSAFLTASNTGKRAVK